MKYVIYRSLTDDDIEDMYREQLRREAIKKDASLSISCTSTIMVQNNNKTNKIINQERRNK